MMVFESTSKRRGAEKAAEQMADFFGPQQIDQLVRQAIQFCWLNLPKEKRNPEELEKQMRRIVERALRDFREDFVAFGSKAKIHRK